MHSSTRRSPSLLPDHDALRDKTSHRATQLPTEILDIIFKQCRQSWQASSLVCRRWRDVLLPHLFNIIIITTQAHPLDARIHFLFTTPWISMHVRTIIVKKLTIDVATIDSLVRSIPHLKTLELRGVELHGTSNMHDLQQSQLTLDTLKFIASSVDPLGHDYFLDLLACFTSIGELVVKLEGTPRMGCMQVAAVQIASEGASAKFAGGSPQCHRLNLGYGVYSSSFIPAFLCRIGGLERLSSLSLVAGPSLGTLSLLNELLCSVGSTLTGLRITFNHGLEWFDTNDNHHRKSSLHLPSFANSNM